MIKLKWVLFPEAENIDYFKLYRSIIGFIAPIVDLTGKNLILKVNGGNQQEIVFTGGNIIDDINNNLRNARAYLSHSGDKFLLRSDLRSAPGSIEIVGGSAMTDLGLSPKLITEKSEDMLIGTAPFTEGSETAEYIDMDGAMQDWYAISTVNTSGDESKKTNYRQPITATGPVCVIEGIVITPQGARVPDAEIIATVQIPPEQQDDFSTMTKDPIRVFSGPDGRFGIPLLRGIMVRLEIPSTGFTKIITVPDRAYVFLNSMQVDLSYHF